jgi:sigma-B regulation protein RsbU (phosphoserine phosphatase)
MKDQWDILTGVPERDRRNVSILMESVAELYGAMALDDVTRRAVDRAIRVTGAERGILLLREDGRVEPCVARSAGGEDLPLDLKHSRSVVDKVASTGEAHLTVDAEDPTAATLGRSVLELRLLSIMAAPLTVKGQTLGLLYVDSTVQAKEFTKEDFAVFNAVGGLIALAVENARLLEEQSEKQRLERELDVAREIQERLFPKDIVPPEGFDLAGEGRPYVGISGDYYDVIPAGDGRLALAVGDVSGHGPGAALYMASTRALLHGLLGRGAEPVEVMRTLNAFLARDMPSHSFMTFFLGVLDPAARSLTYVNAGHNAPIVVRKDLQLEDLPATGPVLSVLEDATYRLSDPVRLEPGDALVLYTDGIYEAHNAADEMYGEDRFRASLAAHVRTDPGADAVIRGVLADLEAFCAGRPLDDDITCLVLRAR